MNGRTTGCMSCYTFGGRKNMDTSLHEKNISSTVLESGEIVYEVRVINDLAPKPIYSFFKRLFDLTVSLLAAIILLVPMLIIALLIKIDSRGPIFYKQERLGLNGKPFMLWKFRSMRVDAEANGAQWATENDSRCTKLGKILRLCRADELPQIYFNIIPGNLSIVGPRPERKVFYDDFSTYINGFEQRMMVKPGLTGYAQVNGGYDLKPEEKIVYDLEYIEKRSLGFDLKIIFRTAAIIFTHDGAK